MKFGKKCDHSWRSPVSLNSECWNFFSRRFRRFSQKKGIR